MCACGAKWQDVAPLILRVVLGAIFLVHGYQKLQQGVPAVSGFVASIGFPFPGLFAVLLIAAEVLGGIFLILGVFTHWSAKILTFVAIVALVTVHLKNGFTGPGGYEFILLILVATLSVMITGAGKYSLDAKMKKKG